MYRGCEQIYLREYTDALHCPLYPDLYNLVKKHSAYMIEMAIHNNKEHKRRLMDSWVKIDGINTRWINVICPIDNPKTQFHNISTKIVRKFSDIMGDYVVDKHFDKEDFARFMEVTTKYYTGIANENTESAQIEHVLKQYVVSVMNMTDVLDKEGSKSDNFFTSARECIAAGKLLGAELDFLLFY